MEFGVQLFGCRKEFREDPERFLARIKEAGYSQFEPCILFDKPEESELGRAFAGELWAPEEVAGFRTMMEDVGLALRSAHAFCSDIPAHLPEMKELAGANGITSYVFNLPELAEEEIEAYAAELERSAVELAEVNCELWLHNTEGVLRISNKADSVKTAGSDTRTAGESTLAAARNANEEAAATVYLGNSLLEKVLARTSHVYTQIDTGWAMYDGRTPQDLIALPGIKLHGLHVKEMAEGFDEKMGADIFAVLGEGVTALEMVLQNNTENVPVVVDQDMSKGDFLADLTASAEALQRAEQGLKARRGDEWDTKNDISLLETYDIETGERTLLHEFPYLIEAPNWSMDGTFLIYNSGGHIYKYILAEDRSEEIPMDFAVNCNNDHVLSADGTSIGISHSQNGWESRVYTVPLTGGVPKEITPKAPSYLHGWSPDGKQLAYCAFRENDDGADVYVMPAEGGEEIRLTYARGLNDGPEYDSAGEYIWFNSVRTGLMQAWRMKADGSEQTQMTFDENWNTWFPHISPDRRKVVMIAYRKGDLAPGQHVPHKDVELRLMDAEGGEPETIVKLFGGQGTINVNSWSPDSKKFAFVSYRRAGGRQ